MLPLISFRFLQIEMHYKNCYGQEMLSALAICRSLSSVVYLRRTTSLISFMTILILAIVSHLSSAV